MKYFAMKGREMALKADGTELQALDLDILANACGATDKVVETSNDITAVYLNDMDKLPDGYSREVIRHYFNGHDEEEILQASRAKALLEWRQSTRYCSKCGAALKDHDTMTARVCPDCGNIIYPRIDPCIIVLVYKDGEILLARHVQRNQDIYACIAGFVEAGETIENAVVREIKEETGLTVKNVQYFGSQSWPFPAQLMFGFTADYESGEITLQAEEIADARWFDPDHCPASPQPGSIAYRLIEDARRKKHCK